MGGKLTLCLIIDYKLQFTFPGNLQAAVSCEHRSNPSTVGCYTFLAQNFSISDIKGSAL